VFGRFIFIGKYITGFLGFFHLIQLEKQVIRQNYPEPCAWEAWGMSFLIPAGAMRMGP